MYPCQTFYKDIDLSRNAGIMGDMEEGAKRPWKAGREPLVEGEKPVKVTLNLTHAQHTTLKEAGSIGGTIRQLVDQWMARRAKKATPKKR